MTSALYLQDLPIFNPMMHISSQNGRTNTTKRHKPQHRDETMVGDSQGASPFYVFLDVFKLSDGSVSICDYVIRRGPTPSE